MIKLLLGDCREVLAGMPAASIDACVTDPPYHLTTGKPGGTGIASLNLKSPAGRSRIGTGFMGKAWDGGDVAFRPETWAEVLRVLKPGAYLVTFGGARTQHRLVCAIEDAGFIIHPMLGWLTGQGFPKAKNLSKEIDKAAGAEREVLGKSGRHSGRTSKDGAVPDLARYADAGDFITAPATACRQAPHCWGRAAIQHGSMSLHVGRKSPYG